MTRKGCIYTEIQHNTGRSCGQLHGSQYIRGVGRVDRSRIRYVAEIMYHGKRHRFRSTNFDNARRWLNENVVRYSD